jgi:O-antigen/teichoic acid export membrane protein
MNIRIVLTYFLGSVGTALLSFALVPIIAWFYSPEDVGKLAILTVFTGLTTLLFSLGLDQAFVREYHEEKNKEQLFTMVFLPTSLFFLIFISCLLLLDINLVSKTIFEDSQVWIGILAVAFAFISLLLRFLSLLLRMEEKAVEYSMSQIVPKIITLVLVLAFVIFSEEKTFSQLIIANLISVFFTLLYLIFITRSFLIKCNYNLFKLKRFQDLLFYGLPLVIGGFASWGLSFFDRVFLKFYSDLSQLGFYSVAISIASVTAIFSSVFHTIWAPLVFKWTSNGTVDRARMIFISDNVLAVVYFFTILTCLFSWLTNYILPPQYYMVEYILPACLLSPLIYTITEISSVGISISRKTIYLMSSAFIAVLVNLFLNFTLVQNFGASGAALSTLFSFYIFYIIRTELSKKLWINLPSKKSYTVVTLLVVLTGVSAFLQDSRELFILINILLFLFGFMIFKENLTFYLLHLINNRKIKL